MKPPNFFLVAVLAALGGTPAAAADQTHEINWGLATNGIKAGISTTPETIGWSGEHVTVVRGYLMEITQTNTSATNSLMLALPPDDRLYKIALVDADGAPVPRTKLGLGVWLPPPEGPMYTPGVRGERFRPFLVSQDVPTALPISFPVEQYFAVPHAGNYTLRLLVTVIWPSRAGDSHRRHLPLVNVPVAEASIRLAGVGGVTH